MSIPTKFEVSQYPLMTGAITVFHAYLVNPSVAGDSIFLIGETGAGGGSPFTSIQDDKGNTFTVDKYQNGGQGAFIASARNIATGGSTKITISLSSTTFCQFTVICTNNVASGGSVATNGANTSGTSIQAGSVTPSTDSLVIMYMADDSGATGLTNPTHFSTSTPAALIVGPNGIEEFTGLTILRAPANVAVNPTVTSGRSLTSVVAAIAAYPLGTGGGAPSTLGEVRQISRLNFNTFKSDPWPVLTYTFDMPSIMPGINAIAIYYVDGNTFHAGVPGNVSSKPDNNWEAATAVALPGGAAACGWVYAKNVRTGPFTTITVTVTTAPGAATQEFQLFVYQLANVKDFLQQASGTGTENNVPPTTVNNVLSSALITTEANEVILFGIQEIQQTPTTVAATLDTALQSMPDTGVYESFDLTHDAGPAHVYARTVGSHNFNVSWSDYEGGLVVSGWGAAAIAFSSVNPNYLKPTRGMIHRALAASEDDGRFNDLSVKNW